MFNFGKSVNRILIPDLSEQAVLSSVVDAGQNYLAQKNYDMMESLDFYYNQNLDKHIEQLKLNLFNSYEDIKLK